MNDSKIDTYLYNKLSKICNYSKILLRDDSMNERIISTIVPFKIFILLKSTSNKKGLRKGIQNPTIQALIF